MSISFVISDKPRETLRSTSSKSSEPLGSSLTSLLELLRPSNETFFFACPARRGRTRPLYPQEGCLCLMNVHYYGSQLEPYCTHSNVLTVGHDAANSTHESHDTSYDGVL